MRAVWITGWLCAALAVSAGCRRKGRPALVTDESGAPVPIQTTTPQPAQPLAPVEVGGVQYTFASDPGSVLTRARAAYSYRIDKFKEDKGRFPKSLAEAGLDKVPLPPGQSVVYNPATGECIIK